MASQKIAKNTAFLLLASVGQKFLSFIYFTIVSGAVGVTGSGKYFLATSFTTMFAVLIDLGLSNVLVREVAKDRTSAPRLLGTIIAMKTAMAAITALLIAVAALLLDYRGELGVMIGLATLVTILDTIHLICYAVMRGEQNLRYEAFGVITGQVITIASGTAFLALNLPLPFLIVALLLGSSWNVIWAVFILVKKFRIVPEFKVNKKTIRDLALITFPFALAGIFSRVYSYIDSVMLSKLAEPNALGFYGVAYKIAFAFQFLPMAFAAAVYPAMAAYTREDKSKLSHLLTTAMEYLLLVVVPISCGIFVLAKPFVITLYGEDFLGTVAPLQILMVSLIFAFLYWPSGSLLNASDRQAKNTQAMFITMVANIIANAILIPRYGALGAASAALIGNVVLFTSAFIFANQVVAIEHVRLLKRTVRIFLAGGTMMFGLTLLMTKIPLVLLVATGGVLYVAAAFLFGAITTEEIRWLLTSMKTRHGKTANEEPVS